MRELTKLQKQVLDLLKASPLKNKFYWTGGTLLSAIYLHHRTSYDIDLFTDQAFTYEELASFIKKLKKAAHVSKHQEKRVFDRWEFFLHNNDEVRLEFARYNFPALKKRRMRHGVYVDSLDDVACNKTMVLFDRNDPKDLFDLYFLLTKSGYTVKKLLKMVEKKFGVKFQEMSFWSETHKTIKNLEELTPLLPQKTKTAKQKLLKEVGNYFVVRSTKRLSSILK